MERWGNQGGWLERSLKTRGVEGEWEFDGRGEAEVGWWEIQARRVEGVDEKRRDEARKITSARQAKARECGKVGEPRRLQKKKSKAKNRSE